MVGPRERVAIISEQALAPKDQFDSATEAVGKNTAACLQSGLVYGYVGLVEGLVARLRVELPNAKTVATGGLASTIGPLTTAIETIDDALTLQGLRLLWELNR